MDINAHLEEMLHQRGWSEYRLAKECGLSESTIANIFRRNCVPSFSTLEVICKAFGISLSQFFAEGEIVPLTPENKFLMENWALLTPEQKDVILKMIQLLLQTNIR